MPVYTSHLTEYNALEIGRRIRGERHRVGLTLQRLARRCKFSAARLSRIENGHHVLDLLQALAIARALGLRDHAFLPEDRNLPCQISRDADVRTRAPQPTVLITADGNPHRKHHGLFWPLADLFVGRHLEPVLARIMPSVDKKPALYHHHQQEFFFVLKGAIEFIIRTPEGLRREEVRRGDCVSFNSMLPHCLRSAGATPAESVHVFAHGMEANTWSSRVMSQRVYVAAEDGTGARAPMRVTGRKLRTFRESVRMTPAQIAPLAGLAVARVQQIERGERPLPIDAMLRLARAFGRQLRDFTAESACDGPHYVIKRCGDLATIAPRRRRMPVECPHAAAANMFVPLAAGFPTREMYPCLVKVPNAEIGDREPHEHHGEEFVYVLDGEVVMNIVADGREIHETLRPGDSCYLDSGAPHVLRGQTRNPYAETSAEVIVVFWSPLGENYLFDLPEPIPA